ncbi:MAG: carboxylating nicotinate-nucleotide diphosphorylase [Thermincolia bacterium]
MELNKWELKALIEKAFEEDIRTGDVTTNSIIPVDAVTTGYIYAKEPGIVAGLPVAEMVFKMLDPAIVFSSLKQDGDQVEARETLAQVSGQARAVLTGERVALNLLQRLSGIATRTAVLVELLTYYNTRVVDTRKTTPGLRFLEKYAVRMGGGHNHRFGLYDAVLIKDNHIKVAGGIKKAVAMARQKVPHTMKIEVEVENLDGVREALEARAEIIMLDNMSLETMAQAVEIVQGEALLEASGGIHEDQVVEIAKLGIDLISIGALSHSVKALDISLDVGEIKTR